MDMKMGNCLSSRHPVIDPDIESIGLKLLNKYLLGLI